MNKLNKLAAAISATLALGYGSVASAAISEPGAIADSFLGIENFTIRAGTGDATKGAILPISFGVILVNGIPALDPAFANATGAINLKSLVNNYQTSANLGGGAGTTVSDAASTFTPGVPVSMISENGIAGFVPGTTLNQPQDVSDTYAAAASTSVGDALADPTGDSIKVHSQVMINQGGAEGHSVAKQNFTTSFVITVDDEFLVEMNFDATGFLRAALGALNQVPNNAIAKYTWNAKVTKQGAAGNLLDWTPNGVTVPTIGGVSNNGLLLTEGNCVLAGACAEYADGFDMDDSIGTNNQNDFQVSKTGSFDVELLLTPGTYTFTVTHETTADAQTPQAVPEPASLALIGLGMLGMGVTKRRKA